jgi:hypothetical protein
MTWYNPLTWLDRAQAARRWASVLNELDALTARVAALEAEISKRPGPDFCPKCASPLRVVHVRPLVSHLTGAQFGECRTFKCASETCDFTRQQDVDFLRER